MCELYEDNSFESSAIDHTIFSLSTPKPKVDGIDYDQFNVISYFFFYLNK